MRIHHSSCCCCCSSVASAATAGCHACNLPTVGPTKSGPPIIDGRLCSVVLYNYILREVEAYIVYDCFCCRRREITNKSQTFNSWKLVEGARAQFVPHYHFPRLLNWPHWLAPTETQPGAGDNDRYNNFQSKIHNRAPLIYLWPSAA